MQRCSNAHRLGPSSKVLEGSHALQGPAAALLTLDCSAALGGAGGRARLSTLGAAMLSTVLRFDKVTVSSTAFLHPSGHSRLGGEGAPTYQ